MCACVWGCVCVHVYVFVRCCGASQARASIIRAEGEAEGAVVISEALAKYGSGIIGASRAAAR